MSRYSMVTTLFFKPDNLLDPATTAWGAFRQLTDTDRYRWRGPVFDGHAPAPGWVAEIEGVRYEVLSAVRVIGKVWRLDLKISERR